MKKKQNKQTTTHIKAVVSVISYEQHLMLAKKTSSYIVSPASCKDHTRLSQQLLCAKFQTKPVTLAQYACFLLSIVGYIYARNVEISGLHVLLLEVYAIY